MESLKETNHPSEPGCKLISGEVIQPLFGQELSAESLANWIRKTYDLADDSLFRRQDRDLFCLDWQKDQIWYTAGLQDSTLLFVNIRFEAEQLPARRVLACFGSPQTYQAWYDSYINMDFSSLHVALVFPSMMAIAYGSRFFTSAATQTPAIREDIPVTTISLFGKPWQDENKVLGKSSLWPGDWESLQIDVRIHQERPPTSDRDLTKDHSKVPIAEVLEQIAQAFMHAPRPPDDELLHPESRDDSDIQALIGVPHWRELPDESIEYEYSALAFLGPAGFRYFLPAYLSWVLRHPDSGTAVVGSTIYALTPIEGGPLREFMLSKYSLLDDAQRSAIVAFLRAMIPFEDVGPALDYWIPSRALV
jgi:hypothetical protein